jgi:hypothetical protein
LVRTLVRSGRFRRFNTNTSPLAHQLVITVIALAASAFLGGALNALAGGGSLVTFPELLFAGLNPIDANASSGVAIRYRFRGCGAGTEPDFATRGRGRPPSDNTTMRTISFGRGAPPTVTVRVSISLNDQTSSL